MDEKQNASLSELQSRIALFRHEHGWDDEDTPRSLSISISLEAAELLMAFQWKDRSFDELKSSPEELEYVKGEIADIMIYSLSLAEALGIDCSVIMRKKQKEREELVKRSR